MHWKSVYSLQMLSCNICAGYCPIHLLDVSLSQFHTGASKFLPPLTHLTESFRAKDKETEKSLGESYLKNSYPSISNVIKIDSSIVWVYIPCHAYIVILVPVYAGIPAAEVRVV